MLNKMHLEIRENITDFIEDTSIDFHMLLIFVIITQNRIVFPSKHYHFHVFIFMILLFMDYQPMVDIHLILLYFDAELSIASGKDMPSETVRWKDKCGIDSDISLPTCDT